MKTICENLLCNRCSTCDGRARELGKPKTCLASNDFQRITLYSVRFIILCVQKKRWRRWCYLSDLQSAIRCLKIHAKIGELSPYDPFPHPGSHTLAHTATVQCWRNKYCRLRVAFAQAIVHRFVHATPSNAAQVHAEYHPHALAFPTRRANPKYRAASSNVPIYDRQNRWTLDEPLSSTPPRRVHVYRSARKRKRTGPATGAKKKKIYPKPTSQPRISKPFRAARSSGPEAFDCTLVPRCIYISYVIQNIVQDTTHVGRHLAAERPSSIRVSFFIYFFLIFSRQKLYRQQRFHSDRSVYVYCFVHCMQHKHWTRALRCMWWFVYRTP